jgi:hypothetical protein
VVYQHFENDADVRGYIESELLATLEDDLQRMEKSERSHYSDGDRDEMRARIHDVRLYISKS